MDKIETFNSHDINSIYAFCVRISNSDISKIENDFFIFNTKKAVESLKECYESGSEIDKNKVVLLLDIIFMLTVSNKAIIDAIIPESGVYAVFVKLIKDELYLEQVNVQRLRSLYSLLMSISFYTKTNVIKRETIKHIIHGWTIRLLEKMNFLSEKNIKNEELFILYSRIVGFLNNTVYKSDETIKEDMKCLGMVDVLFDNLTLLNKFIDRKPYIKYVKADLIMTIINLINENETNNSIILDDGVRLTIDCLREAIQDSRTNPVHNNTKYYVTYWINGCATILCASETLNRLTRLSSSDKVKQLLFEMKIFYLLETILASGNEEEICATCELLCLLCFNQNISRYLRDDKKILRYVQALLCSTTDIFIKTNCDQIVEMVVNEILKKKLQDKNGTTKNGYIMISYNHAYQSKCLQINEKLKNRGYQTWIDAENVFIDLRDTMAKAVENASIVLVCYSNEYKDSGNCRYEAEYAANLGKNMLFVRLESKYNPDGWLGLLLSTKFYIDFAKNEHFAFNYLFNQIKYLLEKESNQDVLHDATSNTSPSIHPKNWNNDEVRKWLDDNKLNNLSNVFANYTGRTLSGLWDMKNKDYVGFRTTIDSEIEDAKIKVPVFERINFFELLDELFKNSN